VSVNVNDKNINKNNCNKANFNKQARNWQHNPQHRRGAPYSNKATANEYGGGRGGNAGTNRPGGGAGARNIEVSGHTGRAGVNIRNRP
jgi:hypothetical protein